MNPITGRRLGRLYRSERLYLTQGMLDEERQYRQEAFNRIFHGMWSKEGFMKIRRKTDHTMVVEVKAFPYLAPDRRWRKDNPQEGTTTYFSDREWEEVPAERWEAISPRLDKEGKILILDWLSEPWGFPQRTVFQLPEEHRFAPFGSGFTIEKKIS